jgi:hypothetical protein
VRPFTFPAIEIAHRRRSVPDWLPMSAENDKPIAPWQGLEAPWSGDAAFTVSRLGAWLYEFFFLPGDCLIWAALSFAPPLARFLELGTGDYGGVLSGFLSALAWLTLLLVSGMLYQGIREADRSATRRLKAAWAEGRRRAIVARLTIAQRWRERRRS